MIKDLQFPYTCIYRPGVLNRGTLSRSVERLAMMFLNCIKVETVAKAMRYQYESTTQATPTTNSTLARVNVLFDVDLKQLAHDAAEA